MGHCHVKAMPYCFTIKHCNANLIFYYLNIWNCRILFRTLQYQIISIMEIDRNKALFQLSVGEFIDLMDSIISKSKDEKVSQDAPKERRLEYGIAGIARIFNCSISTANRIKASGKIDKAISQRGRLIVVDVEKAIQLFDSAKG